MIITSFYASIFSLFFILLSINVIKSRTHHQVILGDNNQPNLQKHIRAHANFIEYTPLFLILLGLLEYTYQWNLVLWVFGSVFFIARIFHAYGLVRAESYRDNKPVNIHYRVMGMMGTFGCIVIASVCLLANVIW